MGDVEAAVARAHGGRSDLARAGHDLQNAATTVEFLGNQRLPDVRLETSYRGNGLGMSAMAERAAELGGTCSIGPRPGGGTAVTAELPLRSAP